MASFWAGKRVFVTYPTSFLGAWVVRTLLAEGAQVFGFGEAPLTTPNLFDLENLGQKISMTFGDLKDESSLRQALQFAEADVLLHLGESGLLRDSENRPVETFANAMLGAANLMELLRETGSIRSVVVVSSDKVYQRKVDVAAYSENDSVGAGAILPTAKLCAEFIALSYRQSFFSPDKYNKHKIALATARIGAAIGGGDFTTQALLPEIVKSFVANEIFDIRNPQSVRPWIHVRDQVRGLLLLAQGLFEKGPKLAPSYNLGAAECNSVGEVARLAAEVWGEQASSLLRLELKPTPSVHGELNSERAATDLGWTAEYDLKKSLKETVQWYKEFYSSGKSAIL